MESMDTGESRDRIMYSWVHTHIQGMLIAKRDCVFFSFLRCIRLGTTVGVLCLLLLSTLLQYRLFVQYSLQPCTAVQYR